MSTTTPTDFAQNAQEQTLKSIRQTQKTVVVEHPAVTNAEARVNAEKNQVNRGVLTGIRRRPLSP